MHSSANYWKLFHSSSTIYLKNFHRGKKDKQQHFFLLSGTTNKSINVSLWMVNCLGRDWHRKQYSLFIFSSVPTAFFIDFSWFRFLRRCSFIVSSEWQKLSTVISCNYFSIKRKLCDIKFTPVSSSAGNRISAKMMREAICRLPGCIKL